MKGREINQDDRSLFSMMISSLVRSPEGWSNLRGLEFGSEENGGVLTTGMGKLLDEFSMVLWSTLGERERLKALTKIMEKLEGGDYSSMIAAESLEWGINNWVITKEREKKRRGFGPILNG